MSDAHNMYIILISKVFVFYFVFLDWDYSFGVVSHRKKMGGGKKKFKYTYLDTLMEDPSHQKSKGNSNKIVGA